MLEWGALTDRPPEQPRCERVVVALCGYAWAASVMTVVMGAVVLIGWAYALEPAKRILPGLVAMNPLTAMLFMLAGVALGLMCPEPARPLRRHIGRTLGALVMGAALLMLWQALTGAGVAIDQWLFASQLYEPERGIANRMAPNTAFNFVLVGLALALTDVRMPGVRVPSQWAALPAVVLSMLAVVGYAYGAGLLYEVATFIPMALHTAVGFLLLSLGLLAHRPTTGVMALVTSDAVAGVIARRLLPAVILIPPMLGAVVLLGQRWGYYDAQFDLAVYVVVIMPLFVMLVFGTAALVARFDDQRQRAESNAHLARDRAEAASRAKSYFLANMSHEIRTPMSAIIGYADLLFEPSRSESDRLNYINTIRRNADHLLTIINDILDLSKIEAGEMNVERITCDPREIINDVASMMRVRAAERELAFQVTLNPPLPARIHTDPTRLRQVLLNLLSNAIKFTEHGRVELAVRLEPSDAEGPARLRFDVSDTGIGLDTAQVDRLFEPFAQADSSTTRRFGGTGLGLAICKQFAHMLGGDITVQSNPGLGSTFTFVVDTGSLEGVEMVEGYQESIEVRDPREDADESALMGRVLLAEDGVDNRALISHFLRQAGLKVETAENGRVACEKVLGARGQSDGDQWPYDLVLMDMQMPELDGYAATARLRRKGCELPIIALTAHAMADDRNKCLNAGCTDYLPKPVTHAKLRQMLAKYLPADARAGGGASRLRSEVEDESIKPYLDSFIAGLPEQVDRLRALAGRQDHEALRGIVHTIKGTAGLYGFMPITELAEQVEQKLDVAESLDEVNRQVQLLIDMLRRVEGYDASLESAPAAKRAAGQGQGAVERGIEDQADNGDKG